MIDVSWLSEAMQASGFRTNKDLAEVAGISPVTVAAARKRKGTRARV